MSLARGGEHHTARASRVISAFHRGAVIVRWRGKHRGCLGRQSRGRSKAETKEGKRGLVEAFRKMLRERFTVSRE